jgi:hypothetical protein
MGFGFWTSEVWDQALAQNSRKVLLKWIGGGAIQTPRKALLKEKGFRAMHAQNLQKVMFKGLRGGARSRPS